MLCKRDLSRHAVSVCPSIRLSVTFVDSVKTNKRIFKIFSPSASHTILIFPYQTAWQYCDGNLHPNEGFECSWGRQKSRFWANIWLHCVQWTVPATSAIHLAATDHGEFITLVSGISAEFVGGGKQRRSVWQEASTLHRRQRYAVVNLIPK